MCKTQCYTFVNNNYNNKLSSPHLPLTLPHTVSTSFSSSFDKRVTPHTHLPLFPLSVSLILFLREMQQHLQCWSSHYSNLSLTICIYDFKRNSGVDEKGTKKQNDEIGHKEIQQKGEELREKESAKEVDLERRERGGV